MQTSTLTEVVQQKNLGQMPVMNYREKNGMALIEIQLQQTPFAQTELPYDAERVIATLRAMQFSLGRATNVTKNIRRERDSSPAVKRSYRKPKKG
jgi:hypothetical protein